MKKIVNGLAAVLLILLILAPDAAARAYTDYSEDISYVYDRYGMDLKIPAAYEYSREISLKEAGGLAVTSPADMFVSEDGSVYVVESELGAILRYDRNLNFQGALDTFLLPDGSVTGLKKPEGVFVTADQRYYIADTGNSRVLVCDAGGNVLLQIEKPADLLGTNLTSFLPTRVVVDSVGRISIVARNMNSGLMQFTAEGKFTGYAGAPSVSVDAFTKLLRKFSTAAQKAQMQQYVPTEYNNIKIDSNNFIWGTISSISADSLNGVIWGKDLSGKVTPIKKLNTMGTDVLRRKGVFPPVGDLVFVDTPSKIIDVGLGPYNMYSLLDSSMGRIFTYNNDGILLYAFGGKGTKKGNLQIPAAIDYVGDLILVLDSGLCQIVVYQPTRYGTLLNDAEGSYEEGDYETANQKWADAAEMNSNFEYAYVGLGNAKYRVGEYKEAMDYYEYADSRLNYSNAKEKLRKETAAGLFPIIFAAVFGLILLYLGVCIYKKIRRYASGGVK